MKIFFILAFLMSATTSIAMTPQDHNEISAKFIESSNKDKEILLNALKESDVTEDEAKAIVEDFELKIEQDFEELNVLTDDEINDLVKKPFVCSYDYKYHYA